MDEKNLTGAEITQGLDAATQTDDVNLNNDGAVADNPNPVDDAQETTVEQSTDVSSKQETSAKEEEEPKIEYKSQKDIDRAIALRLEAARKKWEKEHEAELSLARQLKALYGDDINRIIEEIDNKQAEKLADEWGIPFEMAKEFVEFRKLKNNPSLLAQPQYQANTEERLVDDLAKQEAELKKEIPDFDIVAEMNNNPVFMNMVLNGVPVKNAYYACYPEKIQKVIEQKVIQQIKSRNVKPSEITQQTGSTTKIDVNALTPEQLAELSRRARMGERIEL